MVPKNKKELGRSTINYLIQNYKRRAKLTWNLSEEECENLFRKDCFYCGSPPANKIKFYHRKEPGYFFYSGIDRVDNTRGYEPDNCVPCCKHCNRLKSDRTLKEFLEHIKQVHARITFISERLSNDGTTIP